MSQTPKESRVQNRIQNQTKRILGEHNPRKGSISPLKRHKRQEKCVMFELQDRSERNEHLVRKTKFNFLYK